MTAGLEVVGLDFSLAAFVRLAEDGAAAAGCDVDLGTLVVAVGSCAG